MPWSEDDCQKLMQAAFTAFSNHLSGIRAGRATPALIEGVKVDAYGQKMRLVQLAGIDVMDNATLCVRPFDPSLTQSVDKALQVSGLGFSTSAESTTIIVKIPKMTEETRKNLMKEARSISEGAKVQMRGIRRAEIDKIEGLKTKENASEDEVKRNSQRVQKMTDQFIEKITNECDKKVESLNSVGS